MTDETRKRRERITRMANETSGRRPSGGRLLRRTPRRLSSNQQRPRRRIEKASAILRCLVLVLQHVPEELLEVELLADVAFNLIEKQSTA